jgi:hypothetical protein
MASLARAGWRRMARTLGNDRAIVNARRSCEEHDVEVRHVDARLRALGPDVAPGAAPSPRR